MSLTNRHLLAATAPGRCIVCGCEIPAGTGRRRLLHPACSDFRKYLRAVARAAVSIRFATDGTGKLIARQTRGDLIALANRLPRSRHPIRDDRGRFATAQRNLPL